MVLSTFLIALAQILGLVINIYLWIVIIAALVSWVSPNPYNPIIQALDRLTTPVYVRIRRVIPTVIGGVDLAPIIVIIALKFIDNFAVALLLNYAQRL